MPPLRLTSLLQSTLPDLSKSGRAVVSALACRNGHPPPASEIAAWVGLRDRYQLGRVLRRDGLPPLERLAGWTRILYWLSEAEATGASLLQLARRDRILSAAAYRVVRRVTGRCWSELRRAGLAIALLRFRDVCRRRVVDTRSRPVAPTALWATGTPALAAFSRLPSLHPRGVLADRLAIGGSPFDVACTRTGLALVTRGHAASVGVVRLDPLHVLGCLPTGAIPTRVIASRTGEQAYVTNQFAEEIGILDLRAGHQTGAIAVTGHPLGAVLAPDGRTLYATTNADQVHAISVAGNRVTATTRIPMGSPQVAVHPAGHRLYLSGFKAGVVAECDACTLRISRVFEVGGIVQDVVIAAHSGILYAANETGWVDAIALSTGRRVARIELGTAALGLALSPDEAVLLVSLVFSGRVAVLDATTFALRATLAPGGTPRLMAFARDGRTALVANEAGWIDIVR